MMKVYRIYFSLNKALCFGFSLLCVGLLSSCQKTPVACIQSVQTTAAINETITFTSCSENAEITEWDFGDGASASSLPNATHAYSTAGTYSVKLSAFSKKKKKVDETSISITVTSNGGNTSTPNTWTKKADFGGIARAYAVGFSIGGKGYIGTGDRLWDGPLKDFWEYDPTTNVWTQKSDFISPRRDAVSFSIGSKGYVGTGTDENYSNTKDFREYDPANNLWTKKADFGGTARNSAVGFSIGNKGYLGTGYTNTVVKDFWEYDPATDTWLQKTDFADSARMNASGFSIGNKGYIVAGRRYAFLKDCWEYNPDNDSWLQKSDIGNGLTGDFGRQRAFSFSIGNKGYFGTGDYLTNGTQTIWMDFWEYDPAINNWTLKKAFNGAVESARFGAVGFSIGNKGYAGTGISGSTLKDFWEYTP